MSDSYDDYEAKIQLAEHAWEKRVGEMVKTEHDKQIEIAQAYERGWNLISAAGACGVDYRWGQGGTLVVSIIKVR